ncbi:hypothetical protein [Anaeromicropila herbilytica]|uniref:Deacetylase PdaC domain-containing protein n=1 Tax=Anaeromicropila herbilytica TaxID=2785025 RepID=A0A7R7ICT0_9FIRM|nr:hypothetical protein [Anaeromicropila herbilytica]BCN30847.1 hypothetical protein bsdtb5_21420 [Anaeromicropila herbilytica]
MKKRTILFGIVFIFIMLQCFLTNAYASGKADYQVYIKYYKRNSIIVEFPQIRGLSNSKKQKEINYLLEHEVFEYITDWFNFWDEKNLKVSDILKTISNTKDQTLEFNCHSSFSNNHLLSIRYAVYAYSKGAAHPNTWGYSYTIDLDRLKVLKLNDLIKLDESILNYKGNVIFDRDTYSKPEKGTYKLIDVLNYNGLYTNKEVLNGIINENICWYITKSKGVSFFFNAQNHDEEFVISFQDIKKLINTPYLKILTFQAK